MIARLSFCLVLVGCGGSGTDGDASTDATPRPDTGGIDAGAMTPPPGRPTFAVDRITTGSDQAAQIVLTQPGETVDLLAFTPLELWHMEIGSGSAAAVLTLTEPLPSTNPPPSAARASDGSLHVVWEAVGIRYATNSSGVWAETEVASNGRCPSLALDASGVPHVAFIRLGDEATVARLEGDAWTAEMVDSAPGGRGIPWTAIASENGRLVLTGTTRVGTFWIRVNEGAGWVDQTIDVGDAVFMERSSEQTFAAGGAGTLLTFQSNGRYAAFRASGATPFQTGTIGAQYEVSLDEPVATVVGANTAFIAGQDFGQRLALIAPGAPYWPLVAAVPWDDCGDNIALSMDADDNPIMAAWCSGEVTVFRAAGIYPPEFEARCDEVVTALCDQACACGTPEDTCGYFFEGRNDAGNRSGCMLSARETLCSDSTEPFETLLACLATFDSPDACDVDGYPLPETCWPLSRL